MNAPTLKLRQLVLLVVIVVALVFGVTYLSMTMGKVVPGQSKPGGSTEPAPVQLSFAPDPFDDPNAKPLEVEWHTGAHRDFWFTNDGPAPVTLWLEGKNCKCTHVQIALLPEPWKSLGMTEWAARADDPSLTWEELEKDGKPVTIPAGAAGGLRMHWRGEKLGPERLVANLRTEANNVAGATLAREIPVFFVSPVRFSAEENLKEPLHNNELQAGTLLPGDAATARFICWSATRDQFSLTPLPTGNSCITWGAIERLSPEESQAIVQRDGITLHGAYRVTVQLQERAADGSQLDLGPFRRSLALTSDADPDQPIGLFLTGIVRGEITVGNGSRDHLDFGSFEAGQEKTREVTLSTDRSGLELEVEKVPDFLKVTLEPEDAAGTEGKSWRLRVEVSDHVPVGTFKRDVSVIVLKTKGDKPRRLQIPVMGNVYVK